MTNNKTEETKEYKRLHEPFSSPVQPWRKWGPYISERAWGTVREDYSPDGDAWTFFPHDFARSKAYRWGEDGIAGWCDRYQLLVLALGLWNGKDPILKERLYGLTPNEANHGEDVKEYYFYLDGTPTHSYMKYLYKYPQAAYPYEKLIQENKRLTTHDPEYELLDTGIFDDDRYFDVFVEYAKKGPEDTCVRIQAFNRGPDDAPLHIIPNLWFRNRWEFFPDVQAQPIITAGPSRKSHMSLVADDTAADPLPNLMFDYRLGKRFLYASPGGELLFTNNDTNCEKVFGKDMTSNTPYVKDAFHRQIIHGENTTNPLNTGTKACIHYPDVIVPAGGSIEILLRLTDKPLKKPLQNVRKIIKRCKEEADAFYQTVHPPKASDEEKMIQRQALAGMMWSKQVYLFDVQKWLDGDDPKWPPATARRSIRNEHWIHLNSMRILSMPDKWEYPWFASWDLAFHCVTLSLIDLPLAKEQLWLLLFEQFQHPNGQIPAYEWEFSDLNPPIYGWAVLRVYEKEREQTGKGDRTFLHKCFHKLLINFAWWVNRVDSSGKNIFEGGFLGLDNITVIDRSVKLEAGASLKQSDATGWMGMFCLNLMRMALELADENPAYEHLATKFFEHYVIVGAAMKKVGGLDYELWSEKDGFFYDVLCSADGAFHKFRIRSLVGIIPFFAIELLESENNAKLKEFYNNMRWFLKNRPRISQSVVTEVKTHDHVMHILAIMSRDQIKRLLERVWDPEEFLSPYGLRSLSKYHEKFPFVYMHYRLGYEPAESLKKLKGGNSNWRGPIWFPTTFMLIESLRKLHKGIGDQITVKSCLPGEDQVTFEHMAKGFADRMISIFKRDEQGNRPVFGKSKKFQTDPHWKDYILFYEYYNGDTGEGLGASHQTGWSGLVANLIAEWR